MDVAVKRMQIMKVGCFAHYNVKTVASCSGSILTIVYDLLKGGEVTQEEKGGELLQQKTENQHIDIITDILA